MHGGNLQIAPGDKLYYESQVSVVKIVGWLTKCDEKIDNATQHWEQSNAPTCVANERKN